MTRPTLEDLTAPPSASVGASSRQGIDAIADALLERFRHEEQAAPAVDSAALTAEAEDAWVEEVVSSGADRRAFIESCTPSLFNAEGKRDRAVEIRERLRHPPPSLQQNAAVVVERGLVGIGIERPPEIRHGLLERSHL